MNKLTSTVILAAFTAVCSFSAFAAGSDDSDKGKETMTKPYPPERHGAKGLQEFSLENLLEENPQHLMFNGTMDALTKTYQMEANRGDNVRIYFGVGGPNLASSFHVIGEVFDKVYNEASLTAPPLTDVQTTLVPPGGATIVEFKVDVPGRYMLVDHALSRMEKGLAGYLNVRGEANREIFRP